MFSLFKIKKLTPWRWLRGYINCLLHILGMMCIVKPDGPPQLCKTDEIGEICVSSRTGGMMYYGLSGVTKNTFEVCNCTFFIQVDYALP